LTLRALLAVIAAAMTAPAAAASQQVAVAAVGASAVDPRWEALDEAIGY
jgi:hypothetical protein